MPGEDELQAVARRMAREGERYDDALQAFRREFLLETLRMAGGNQCTAAARVGIHRNTLARRLREAGIEHEQLMAIRTYCTRRAQRKKLLAMKSQGYGNVGQVRRRA